LRGATGGSSRGSHSSHFGRYQLASPSSVIEAGSRTARMIVASIRTATARPMPISFMSRIGISAKTKKTPTMTRAALVTTLAVEVIPCSTASFVERPIVRLAHAAQDEDVVVHREPEQYYE